MEIPVRFKAPQITIDHEKCTVPFLCKKCIRGCPQLIFRVSAAKVERGRETDPREPGSYRLSPGSRFKCSGCNDCIEICPVDAITITWPE